MNIKIHRKRFAVGNEFKKTTVDLHKPMYEALKSVAALDGDDLKDVIREALEAYLETLASEGYIPYPNLDNRIKKVSGDA